MFYFSPIGKHRGGERKRASLPTMPGEHKEARNRLPSPSGLHTPYSLPLVVDACRPDRAYSFAAFLVHAACRIVGVVASSTAPARSRPASRLIVTCLRLPVHRDIHSMVTSLTISPQRANQVTANAEGSTHPFRASRQRRVRLHIHIPMLLRTAISGYKAQVAISAAV